MARNEVRERLMMDGPRALSDADLLEACGAETVAGVGIRQLAWGSVAELLQLGLGGARAAGPVAAFELGGRGAWASARGGAARAPRPRGSGAARRAPPAA